MFASASSTLQTVTVGLWDSKTLNLKSRKGRVHTLVELGTVVRNLYVGDSSAIFIMPSTCSYAILVQLYCVSCECQGSITSDTKFAGM